MENKKVYTLDEFIADEGNISDDADIQIKFSSEDEFKRALKELRFTISNDIENGTGIVYTTNTDDETLPVIAVDISGDADDVVITDLSTIDLTKPFTRVWL